MFIIRDTAQLWGEHTKKFFSAQKQGRDTHPERKGIGILSNEEESKQVRNQAEIYTQRGVQGLWKMMSTVHQKLGRDTHLERSAGVLSEEEHGMEVT